MKIPYLFLSVALGVGVLGVLRFPQWCVGTILRARLWAIRDGLVLHSIAHPELRDDKQLVALIAKTEAYIDALPYITARQLRRYATALRDKRPLKGAKQFEVRPEKASPQLRVLVADGNQAVEETTVKILFFGTWYGMFIELPRFARFALVHFRAEKRAHERRTTAKPMVNRAATESDANPADVLYYEERFRPAMDARARFAASTGTRTKLAFA
jgi:hypothetical protein